MIFLQEKIENLLYFKNKCFLQLTIKLQLLTIAYSTNSSTFAYSWLSYIFMLINLCEE